MTSITRREFASRSASAVACALVPAATITPSAASTRCQA